MATSVLTNGHRDGSATSDFSRDDFIAAVHEMRSDQLHNPAAWENHDLPSFLAAIAAWTEDMDGYYANIGQPVPDNPWQLMADILRAAKCYE